MRTLILKSLVLLGAVSLLLSCNLLAGGGAPTPTVTALPPTETAIPPTSTETAAAAITPTTAPPEPALEPTPGPAFCNDARVQAVVSALEAALIDQDGAALAAITDPGNGLDIFYRLANEPVHVTYDEVVGIFTSTFAYTWGDQAGSGLPVEGAFSDEILPLLLDVTERDYTQACQDLTTGVGTGPTTAFVNWPEQFADIPFIALFRAPGPQDNELDWRTWAVGFTVVDGQPKIRVLVQYVWEI